MRVLVTGSRTWTEQDFLWGVLDAIADQAAREGFEDMTVVHGCAKGADTFADRWVRRGDHPLLVTVDRYPAQWSIYGKRAGIVRNDRMVKAGADVCVAFINGESRGTRHCADAAEAAGIPTERWEQP